VEKEIKEINNNMEKKIEKELQKMFPQSKMSTKQELENAESMCTGRYQPLSEYFKGYSKADLEKLDEEDFLEIAKPEHRILMKLFIRNLQSSWFPTDPFDSVSSPRLPSENIAVTEDGVLNLKHEVVSKMFKNDRLPFISITSLSSKFKNDRMAIKNLDLSDCNLVDQDLPIIADFVLSLPNCEILNLSYNRFHGMRDGPERIRMDKALEDILVHKKLRFLDVTGNPLASVDRKDLFKKLTNKQLTKLIWIPFSWLEGKGWQSLVADKQAQEVVLTTHRTYYSLM